MAKPPDAYTQRKARDARAASPQAAEWRALADALRHQTGRMSAQFIGRGYPWTVAQAVTLLDLAGGGWSMRDVSDQMQSIRPGIGRVGISQMLIRLRSYTPPSEPQAHKPTRRDQAAELLPILRRLRPAEPITRYRRRWTHDLDIALCELAATGARLSNAQGQRLKVLLKLHEVANADRR